jgi:hypothetical protein
MKRMSGIAEVLCLMVLGALLAAAIAAAGCAGEAATEPPAPHDAAPHDGAAPQRDAGLPPGDGPPPQSDGAAPPRDGGGDGAAPAAVTFTRHTVTTSASGAAFATVADVDGDGTLDLVVSSFGTMGMSIPNGTVTVYERGADLATWTVQSTVVAAADGVKFPNHPTAVDLDGDGDLDLVVPAGFLACTMGGLGSACGALLWFEQSAGGWVKHTVVAPGAALFYHHAVVVDFDGDGILDLVTVGEEKGGLLGGSDRAETQWFKGIAGADRFETTPRTIGAGGGSFPTVVDLDGDGDLDVVSAEYFHGAGDSFVWFKRTAAPDNANPHGTFVRHVANADSGPGMMLRLVPDLYGDGVTRALVANHTNTAQASPDPWESALFVFDLPADLTTPWTKHQITQGIASVAGSMFAPMAAPGIFAVGDIDGDGDLDVLLAGDGDPRVFWIEQTSPGTWATHVLETSLKQAGGIEVVDLDGDGRNELVVTGYEANAVYVYVRN